MKKYLIILLLLVSSFVAAQQNTFNHRLHFDRPLLVYSSVLATDSCYHIIGHSRDTALINQKVVFYTRLDLNGEVDFTKSYFDTLESFGSFNNTLIDFEDGSFAYAGTVLDSTGNAYLLKYKSNGEVDWLTKYQSPYSPSNSLMVPIGMLYDTEILTVYLLCNIFNGAYNRSIILKLNINGEIEWSNVYWGANFHDTGQDLILKDNGNILISGVRQNKINGMDFDIRARLYEINSEGNVIWSYLSSDEELLLGATALNEDADGNIVFVTYEGEEFPINQGAGYTVGSIRFIKLDKETKEEIWRTPIRSPDGAVPLDAHYVRHIIKSNEGDGYIAVGGMHQVNEAEGGWDQDGVIIKIAENGDSLWHRRLSVITSKGDWHQLRDVESTSDGGYIMVGEARYDYNPDILADPPRQGGWVIKVDEYGCLVPGCHLTSTYEPDAWQGRILLYPNPVKDYLNLFFQTQETTRDMTFAIVNLQGQVVQQFQPTSNEVTMMVDVNHYPIGQYYLVLEKEGQVLWREGFVKVE